MKNSEYIAEIKNLLNAEIFKGEIFLAVQHKQSNAMCSTRLSNPSVKQYAAGIVLTDRITECKNEISFRSIETIQTMEHADHSKLFYITYESGVVLSVTFAPQR